MQNSENKPTKIEKEVKNHKIAIIISYIFLSILFLLFFLFKCQCGNSNYNEISKGSIEIVEPHSNRDLQEEVNKALNDGMFNIFMNTVPTFENGKSKGNLLIQNIESNNVPVIVEIYEKDGNELIYKSEKLLPGYKIEEAQLSKELEKGTYDCIAYFNILDETNDEITNKIGLNLKISIEN